jgi:hypothetical protein
MVLLVVEIAIAVAALVFMQNSGHGLEERLLRRLKNDYGRQDQQIFSDSLDFTQYKVLWLFYTSTSINTPLNLPARISISVYNVSLLAQALLQQQYCDACSTLNFF